MPLHRLPWLCSNHRAIHILFNNVYILQESNGSQRCNVLILTEFNGAKTSPLLTRKTAVGYKLIMQQLITDDIYFYLFMAKEEVR